MKIAEKKQYRRWRRHRHLRRKLNGTAERPRLNIFRSLKHIYCQLIDDNLETRVGKNFGGLFHFNSFPSQRFKSN